MKIYVATSWKNPIQDIVVRTLETMRFEVYDFKNPHPGNTGFSWKQVQPLPPPWTVDTYLCAIEHPTAKEGFWLDMNALGWCDVCVLVLPCGKSAHLELGWAVGAGKRTIVYMPREYEPHEPELMYKMCDFICGNIGEVALKLDRWRKGEQ